MKTPVYSPFMFFLLLYIENTTFPPKLQNFLLQSSFCLLSLSWSAYVLPSIPLRLALKNPLSSHLISGFFTPLLAIHKYFLIALPPAFSHRFISTLHFSTGPFILASTIHRSTHLALHQGQLVRWVRLLLLV